MKSVKRVLIVLSLTVITLLVTCKISKYPYFIRTETPCIGLQYDEDVALVISFYSEGDFGASIVIEVLENTGYEVLTYQDMTELSVENLMEKKISMVWVFSGCSGTALSDDEIDELYDYSEEGGSLVVLADNIPCTVGVDALAGMFDVAFAESPTMNVERLTKENGTLKEHCITANLDSLAGGVTPSSIVYPEDDEDYVIIAETSADTLFVVLQNETKRVFFDSAWTRYCYTDWATGEDVRDEIETLIENIAAFLKCDCN